MSRLYNRGDSQPLQILCQTNFWHLRAGGVALAAAACRLSAKWGASGNNRLASCCSGQVEKGLQFVAAGVGVIEAELDQRLGVGAFKQQVAEQ